MRAAAASGLYIMTKTMSGLAVGVGPISATIVSGLSPPVKKKKGGGKGGALLELYSAA